MEFTFETKYDEKALTALNRSLRKTFRRGRSLRTRILGGILAAAVLYVSFGSGEFVFNSTMAVVWMIAAVLILMIAFEDKINGKNAVKRLKPGTNKVLTTFSEELYRSRTQWNKSKFAYDGIAHLTETDAYFILLLDANRGQILSKKGLFEGSEEEFRTFMENRMGKTFVRV